MASETQICAIDTAASQNIKEPPTLLRDCQAWQTAKRHTISLLLKECRYLQQDCRFPRDFHGHSRLQGLCFSRIAESLRVQS